jgi:hypothetical protein
MYHIGAIGEFFCIKDDFVMAGNLPAHVDRFDQLT